MNREAKIREFQKTISYTFRDKRLLEEVFVHRSFLNEKAGRGLRSNERLEFLGDAVLSTAISHILTERFPDMDEGGLSRFRARLVSEKTLSLLAKDMGLGRYMLLGKGESLQWGSGKQSILADVSEALIAAIYLDGGFKKAFMFISERVDAMIDYLSEKEVGIDYKTALQEYTQKAYKIVPKYKVVDESGPDHKRVFHVDVMIRGDKLGTGKGWSKKEAQQQAARVALEKLKA